MKLFSRLAVAVSAVALTAAFFLVLPLIQAITSPPDTDTILRDAETIANPDDDLEMEDPIEEEEPEEEEEPPELEEQQEAPPIDLAALENALSAGAGNAGWGTQSLDIDVSGMAQGPSAGEGLFSLGDLDQKPRVIYQPGPVLNAKVRKKAPGTVYILFIVDENGKVRNPIVQSSPDPVFEKPALTAVKKWKFEPGKREGKPVSFRMRVPITFPEA